MNIYSVERTDNIGWDEYDSFVCYAKAEDDARRFFPDSNYDKKLVKLNKEGDWDGTWDSSWVNADDISSLNLTLIGTNDKVNEEKIIMTSYNAG